MSSEEAGTAVPVRGTQSFVGVMAEVFRRPSLTGLEVLWRWLFWAAVLIKPSHWLMQTGADLIGSFQAHGFSGLGQELVSAAWQVRFFAARGDLAIWAGVVAAWWLVSAYGRTLVLRRLDPRLRPRLPAMFVLSVLRWTAWAVAILIWAALLLSGLRLFVFGPQSAGRDPAWVPFSGVMIAGTLLLFVLWLGSSWVLSLTTLYSAAGDTLAESLLAAFRRGPLAGKLAEINLVLGIVKIALLVLAMVFSACPLPFETVETQAFLIAWTAGVVLLYFAVSDYFHVVRTMALLRMSEALVPLRAAAQDGEAAS